MHARTLWFALWLSMAWAVGCTPPVRVNNDPQQPPTIKDPESVDLDRTDVLVIETQSGTEEYPVLVSATGTPLIDEEGRKLFHGTAYAWHPDGAKLTEGQFVMGYRQGLWTWWHEDGTLFAQGHYVDGKQDGVWTYWHKDGSIEYESIWDHGEKVETETGS